MKLKVLFFIALFLSFSNSSFSAVPAHWSENAPGEVLVVLDQSKKKARMVFDINANVSQTIQLNYGKANGKKRCSWRLVSNASISLSERRPLPYRETIYLIKDSDEGSHGSGIAGTCGDSESQWTGNWKEVNDKLSAIIKDKGSRHLKVESHIKNLLGDNVFFKWTTSDSLGDLKIELPEGVL